VSDCQELLRLTATLARPRAFSQKQPGLRLALADDCHKTEHNKEVISARSAEVDGLLIGMAVGPGPEKIPRAWGAMGLSCESCTAINRACGQCGIPTTAARAHGENEPTVSAVISTA